MDRETIIGFGIGALAGGLIVYMIMPKTTQTSLAPTAASSNGFIAATSTTRWTSGYHGPINGIYPEAGVAEYLFPYGRTHKVTQLSPTYQASIGTMSSATNGNTIFVD